MSTGGSTIISTLLSFTSPFEKPAKYSSEKLNLKVTFKFSAGSTVIEEWEKSFKRASKILFHATEGQLQFGNINYTVVSGGYTADAHLFEEDGLSSTGNKMYLCGDERYSPFTIVHELAHYAFCLGDEYQIAGGAVGSAYCSNDASTGRCIMEHHHTDGDQFDPLTGDLDPGTVYEFCDETNHHTTAPINEQQTRHGHSCWHTITNTDPFTGFTVPSTPRIFSDVGHQAVTWSLLSAIQKFLFVLDNTATFSSTPSYAGMINALSYWIDYCWITGENLGLVGAGGEDIFELQAIDSTATRDEAKLQLTNLPLVDPNASDALGSVLGIYQQQEISSNQTVVLLRSGPEANLPGAIVAERLNQRDVRAYPVDVGLDAHSTTLETLARQTSGVFKKIGGDLNQAKTAHAVQDHFVTLSADMIDGGGLLAREGVVLPADDTFGLGAAQKKTNEQLHAVGDLPGSIGKDKRVLVEQSCDRVNFVLHRFQNDSLKFVILDPSGAIVEPDNQNVVRVENTNTNYTIWSVVDPTPGPWTMRVLRGGRERLRATALAFAENTRLNVQMDAFQIDDQLVIGCKGLVEFNGPVVGLPLPTIEVYPSKLVEFDNNTSSTISYLYPPEQLVDDGSGPSAMTEGRYVGFVEVPDPGTYTIVGRFLNTGVATNCERCCEGLENCDGSVPAFERIVIRQVTVRT